MATGKHAANVEGKNLPRILYYSDVPVELSFGGATLNYRLLEHYPKDKLLIVQGMEINTEARIKNVLYHVDIIYWLDRVKRTRVGKWALGFSVLDALFGPIRYKKEINDFKPDIILSVSFRLMWIKAFRLKKQLNIPFYFVLHDDWLTAENYGVWQKKIERIFKKVYRQASGRFCISPNMENYYYELFKIHGNVLYPLRAQQDKLYPAVHHNNVTTLKFCYAGSLYTGDFASMLNEIAKVLATHHFELYVFSPTQRENLMQYEFLQKPHVKFYGLMPPQSLISMMNTEMDVAIMLNSFEHELPFRYNFSSKLVDYSSSGLPVMMWGPAGSGAINWAIGVGYSAVISTLNKEFLEALINQFNDDDKRKYWAEQMTMLGREQFSFERNYKLFIEAISC